MMKNILCFVVAICAHSTLFSQKLVVDEVVAVVGKNEVLLSDIENQYLQFMAQGGDYSGDLKCEILEELLIQKLLLHKAELDSVEVTNDMVESQLNQRMAYFIAQIGTEKRLEEYFNKSIYDIKDDLRASLKDQMLTDQMRGEIIGGVNVTPAGVKKFYHEMKKDSIPLIEGQLEYAQLVVHPPQSDRSVDEIRQKLLDFRKRILNGEKFSALAALYSEGPSASVGGEIGFMSKAEVDPEYAKAAFSLQEGAVSKIIESNFGYHIIQLIERKGEKVNTRHIIMKPKITSAQSVEAKYFLDSLRTLIISDSITFKSAVFLHTQDEKGKLNGGVQVNPKSGNARYQISDLNQRDYFVLKGMQIGEVSKPFQTEDEHGKTIFKMVKLINKIEPHRADLKQDYSLVSRMAEQKVREEALDAWVKSKIESTYIKIGDTFKNCAFRLDTWLD